MEEKNKFKKTSICFISTNPGFIGGMSLYIKNFLTYLKKFGIDEKFDITWVYAGRKDKKYESDRIKYVEIRCSKHYPSNEIDFNFKLLKFFKKNFFDIINIHATNGFWTAFYKKKKNQKIVTTYHGITSDFYKNHMKRFGFFKRIFLVFPVVYGYLIEMPPAKKSDKVICVSEKVKKRLFKLFGKRKNVEVVRSGVDLDLFKPGNKNKIRGKLGLKKDYIYGLYVGRGGFFTKGLDRAIRLSEKIYTLNKDYRLIVIGPDKDKVKNLIKKEFVIFIPVMREGIKDYYNAADIFFCLSRYEGGAPTLVVGEAMASGCLIIASRDSQQEILEDEKNSIILKENYVNTAKRILGILRDNTKLKRMLDNSHKTIARLSIENVGKKYLGILSKK